MLIGSYRDDEIGPRHPLRSLLGDLAGLTGVHRVAVEPLSLPGVARLAADRAVDAEELYRVTGGNPFFVTEVLAAGRPGIPRSVGDAVAGRMARASAQARRVAEVAAVIGSQAPVWMLAELVGTCEEQVTELVGLGILQPCGDGVTFRHELARMAVLDAMPSFERSAWHRKVLELLRADPARASDNVLLTHHAEAAGDAAAVLEYAPAAASEAAGSGAFREAAAHFRQALRLDAELSPVRRAALLEGFAQTSALAGRIPEALDAFRTASELRAQIRDHLREGDTLRWLSWLSWPAGRCTEAREIGRRAIEVLERLPPSPELAWANVTACQLISYDGGDLTEAEETAQRAVALGHHFADPEAVAQARFHLLVSRYATGRSDSSELETLRRDTHDVGLVDAAAYLATIEAGFTATHRDHHGTAAAWTFLDELSRERQIHRLLRAAGTSRARSLMHQGRWQDAVELAGKTADQAGELPLSRAVALVVLGLVRARRGDPDAWEPLDEAGRIFEPTGWPRLIWAARAEAAWLAGDCIRARYEAEYALVTTTPQSDPWVVGELARWAVLAGGDAPTARVAEPFALELAGDWPGAAAAWERLDCPYDAALARLLGGDVPALLAALSAFDSLGARPLADRARARLRALGVRSGSRGPRLSTRANRNGLTARQTEIMDLVADGYTDAQIAARLHLSAKTVNNHVCAVLARLGVHSRAEAVRTIRDIATPS
jgi:DNA-binding CsgD family transcriptional regulator/tetratricopeptide (TPR) repeat protein